MQTPLIHVKEFDEAGPIVTAYTVGLVGDFIARGSVHPGFRRRVLAELEAGQVAGHDHAAELAELYDWVTTPPWEGGAAVYRKDPWLMEWVQTVGSVLGVRAGDCDCLTVLLGAGTASVGHRVRLVTVAWKPNGPDRHIYLVVQPHGDLPWVPVDPTDPELVAYGEHPPGAARLTLWDLEGHRLATSMRRGKPISDLGILPEMLLRRLERPTERSPGWQRGGWRALQEWAKAHQVIGRGAKKFFPQYYEAGRAMHESAREQYGDDAMVEDGGEYPGGVDVELMHPDQMLGEAKEDMQEAAEAALRARRAAAARRRALAESEARRARALAFRARQKARLAREAGASEEEAEEILKSEPREGGLKRGRGGRKGSRDRGRRGGRGLTRRGLSRRHRRGRGGGRKGRGRTTTAGLEGIADALELLNEGVFDDDDDGLLGHLEGLSDHDLDEMSYEDLEGLGDRAARQARRARRRAARAARRAQRVERRMGRRGARHEARQARREQRQEMRQAAQMERQRRRIQERMRRRAQRQSMRQQRRGERRGSREARRLARLRERLIERRPEAFEPMPEAPLAPEEYYGEEQPYGMEVYEEPYPDEYWADDEGDYYAEDEGDYYYEDEDDWYYEDEGDEYYEDEGFYGLQGLANAIGALEAGRCPGKEPGVRP